MSRVRLVTNSPERCEWLLQALLDQNHFVEVVATRNASQSSADFQVDPNKPSSEHAAEIATAFVGKDGTILAISSPAVHSTAHEESFAATAENTLASEETLNYANMASACAMGLNEELSAQALVEVEPTAPSTAAINLTSKTTATSGEEQKPRFAGVPVEFLRTLREGLLVIKTDMKLSTTRGGRWLTSLLLALAERRDELESEAAVLHKPAFSIPSSKRERSLLALWVLSAATVIIFLFSLVPGPEDSATNVDPVRAQVNFALPLKLAVPPPDLSMEDNNLGNEGFPEVVVHHYKRPATAVHLRNQSIKKFSDTPVLE